MTPATPKIALFIIDVQEEFLNGHTKHLPPLMAGLQQQYSRVFVTRFVNPPDSPFRKLLDHRTPHPDNIEPRLTFLLAHHAKVRNKSTYSALDRRLITELHMSGVSELHLAGNDTDACVMATRPPRLRPEPHSSGTGRLLRQQRRTHRPRGRPQDAGPEHRPSPSPLLHSLKQLPAHSAGLPQEEVLRRPSIAGSRPRPQSCSTGPAPTARTGKTRTRTCP